MIAVYVHSRTDATDALERARRELEELDRDRTTMYYHDCDEILKQSRGLSEAVDGYTAFTAMMQEVRNGRHDAVYTPDPVMLLGKPLCHDKIIQTCNDNDTGLYALSDEGEWTDVTNYAGRDFGSLV